MIPNTFEPRVQIPINAVKLEGMLVMAARAQSGVFFVHGSGGSRHGLRNNFVAQIFVGNHRKTPVAPVLPMSRTGATGALDSRTFMVRIDFSIGVLLPYPP